MSFNSIIFAACLILTTIPGFLTKPADMEPSFEGAERRWADPRADLGSYTVYDPIPSNMAYKKNSAMHAGSFESSYKMSSKKYRAKPRPIVMTTAWREGGRQQGGNANQGDMISEIIEILSAIQNGKNPQGLTMTYYDD